MKICNKCKQEKDVSLFNIRTVTSRKGKTYKAIRSCCKECDAASAREYRKNNYDKSRESVDRYYFKKRYGITLEERREMLDKQEHKCYLCGTLEAGGATGTFVVDHDHATGVVRKLLCNLCNVGLGALRDDPDLLRKAADYIESYRQEEE